ncbi:MAG: rhamnulokinase [Actinobacteria bacterium]|nr:rhamnulokinase [Actinomycetota bacterium]
MTEEATFLAIDLGAESGRALLGRFDGERVTLEEVHRFPNVPVRVTDGLHWDALRLMGCVYRSLSKAARKTEQLESVGIDSWGVDFALLDREGVLVSNPYHHRDPRTEGMIERALEQAPKEEIYETTGIQFMRINTLYQLLALEDSPLWEVADTLLLIPDLMNYWLTGEKTCEFTNATTTQLYDLEAQGWAEDLLQKTSLPDRIFPKIVPPATKLGPLLPEVAEEVGLDEQLPVIAVASHDTASAVVAVPAEGDDFAYISSGTWSLVGVETPQPVVTPEAMEANFTNEGGFGGRTRFLKNVMGLWLLQECQRIWAGEGQDYSYEELTQLAEDAPAFGPLVDPDHHEFLSPGDMPSRIRRFCKATGQEPPEEPGAVARCVFESLALKYRWVIEQAGELTGQPVGVVHVVGGGSQSSLLCQLTADAARLPVLAGPVEATALGNVMVQAYSRGHVGSLEEIRAVVRRSTELSRYEPEGDEDDWDKLRERFSGVMDASPEIDSLEGG